MPGLFTFIGNEWENIMQFPDVLLPGIEQVSIIYWSGQKQELKVQTQGKNGILLDEHRDLILNPESRSRLQKFRTAGRAYEWIRLSESPLILSSQQDIDPDIFTEIQNTILVLRYRSDSDGRYDVLIIYFNKSLSQFGAMVSEKVLSTDNKAVIGHILYNYFKSIYTLNRRNHQILISIQQSIRSLVKENDRLKDDLRQASMNQEEMIINLSRHYLQGFADKYHRDYYFSDEALGKLRSYRGNIRHLPSIIEQAVVFCENILYFDSGDAVRIEDAHITFDNFQVDEPHVPALKKIDSRESKTIQLLDKLEKAAIYLKGKDMPLTGANIGRTLAQPITAPAITDALKKHRQSIISLLAKYPEKWEVIRGEFKPVQNLFRDVKRA